MNDHRTYALALRSRLPAYVFQPVPHRVLWIVPYCAIVAGGIAAIVSGNLPFVGQLAVSVLVGLAFGSLGFLGHEILHGAVVRRGWLRDVLGGVCMLPASISPMLWRLWHNVEHHGSTQIHGRDPDAYSTLEEYHERLVQRILHRVVPAKSILFFALLSLWLSVHSLIVLVHTLPKLKWRDRLLVGSQTVIAFTFWIVLGIGLGWGKFILFYGIPLLIGNFVVMAYIATNHLLNPLQEESEDDPLASSLTVTVPKLLDIVHSHFSHHTEHHIFPAMNPKYAPHVKRLIKELWPERYHEMPLWQALATLWRTPRLYLDNVRLIEPRSGETYGVLGHGLDPSRLAPLE